MASETIVAVFRTAAEAQTVVAELRSAGISDSAIEQHSQASGHSLAGGDSTLASPEAGAGEQRSGFWAWLLGEENYKDGAGQGDHGLYDQTIASGGVVLSVIVSDTDTARVVSLIEKHHPVDIDEHVTAGHSGTPALGAAAGNASTSGSATATGALPTLGETNRTAAVGTAPVGATAATAGREGEVLALAEESLTVGKREVERGTARIRRYVVERPVEEQIRLRTESLRVERRPVSGTAAVAGDAFSEKVIEVRETAEEAVVGKTARVVEEVAIGKDVSERVETVHDKVRREEIEVVEAGNATTQRAPVATETKVDGTSGGRPVPAV